MECTSQDIMLRIDSDKCVQQGKERYSSHLPKKFEFMAVCIPNIFSEDALNCISDNTQ